MFEFKLGFGNGAFATRRRRLRRHALERVTINPNSRPYQFVGAAGAAPALAEYTRT